MDLIQKISTAPYQAQVLILADGTSLSLTLYFRPMQFGWFITELAYQGFILQGLRITNSPNMLNQFQNQIPFGLACFSTNNREPSQQQDFSSGASKLYILSSDEVKAYEDFLKRG